MVSAQDQSMGPDLTDREGEFRTYYPKHRFNHRYQDPKDEPGTVFVEQEHISHGPGFVKEHRVVKLDRSRERRDLSQTEHRRSSTSDNQQRRKAVLSEQGILRFHRFHTAHL